MEESKKEYIYSVYVSNFRKNMDSPPKISITRYKIENIFNRVTLGKMYKIKESLMVAPDVSTSFFEDRDLDEWLTLKFGEVFYTLDFNLAKDEYSVALHRQLSENENITRVLEESTRNLRTKIYYLEEKDELSFDID